MHRRINTHLSNHNLKEGWVETSEVEEEEEDLAEEEVKSYAINVDNQSQIFPRSYKDMFILQSIGP